MPPQIITITSEKGGCGKTTTAQSLAYELAQRKKKVLVADLDAQINLSYWLTPADFDRPSATIFTSLRYENPTPIVDAIVPTVIDNVDLIYGDRRLGMIDSELAMFNRPLRRLRSILRAEGQATTSYDFIIIDSAPGVSRLLLNGLVAADQLIIPCTASDLALQGVQKITDSVDRLSAGEDRELDIDMPVRVLFTMFRPTTKIAQAAIKRVTNRYGITPYTTYIRQSVRAAEAPGYHQPLAVYEPSGVSDDYRAFAEEFLNDGQE